jgi:hypothetical protein
MSHAALLRLLLVLGAYLLTASAGGAAHAQETVRLFIGAQPGQTARITAHTDVGLLIFAGGDPLTLQLHNEATQAFEAVAVAADGTVTWKTRLLRMTYEKDGKAVMRYDAEDPDSNLIPAELALDKLEVMVEQESDGSIRDFHVQGVAPQVRATIEKALEDSIEKSVLVVPKDPVAIGQSWGVGQRTIPFPGIGRVEYRLMATLIGISAADSGARAELRLDAVDARFVPDSDSKLAGKLSSFRLQGDAQYEVDGRYLRSQDTYGFLSVVAPNPEGGSMTLQIFLRVGAREERDDFGAEEEEPADQEGQEEERQ